MRDWKVASAEHNLPSWAHPKDSKGEDLMCSYILQAKGLDSQCSSFLPQTSIPGCTFQLFLLVFVFSEAARASSTSIQGCSSHSRRNWSSWQWEQSKLSF